MVRVLFVCLGNICRSPTAEGLFRHLVERHNLGDKIFIDSAGTHAFHVGAEPDSRAQAEAKRRGIDISGLRGRQATAGDFDNFDYVLAMDTENHQNLMQMCSPHQRHKLSLFLGFATTVDRQDVPDPYYDGNFESVFNMIEDAAEGLLTDIREKHLS